MRRLVLLAVLLTTISTSTEAQRTVEWDGWSAVACYPGLDFRIGHTGPPLADGYYVMHVQFRNRYRANIYFDYVVREPGAETPVEYRTLEGILSHGSRACSPKCGVARGLARAVAGIAGIAGKRGK